MVNLANTMGRSADFIVYLRRWLVALKTYGTLTWIRSQLSSVFKNSARMFKTLLIFLGTVVHTWKDSIDPLNYVFSVLPSIDKI